jgi:murein L,D-transpeptidase YafK
LAVYYFYPEKKLPENTKIDKILVYKSKRQLLVYSNGTLLKTYGISYPNKQDIENAKEHGKPAGGDIKIHGYRNGLGFIGKFWRWSDWTFGCIALTNKDVDELYKVIKPGTMIEIKP